MGHDLQFVDAHCHLASEAFAVDLRDVIARAQDVGVVAAVAVGEHYEDNLRVLDAAAKHPFLVPALGHHPWFMDRAGADVPRTLRLIEENALRIVAIGEVGLDYRTAEKHEDREYQRGVFQEFIDIAKRLDLPLSVHVRSAGHYVIDILKGAGCPSADLHAFDGKTRYVTEGAEAGFHFSIPGTVLTSPQKRKLAIAVPLNKLLLESDAPALSPQAGVRSEPALLQRIARQIAELRRIDEQEVADAAYHNAVRLFRLPLPPAKRTK